MFNWLPAFLLLLIQATGVCDAALLSASVYPQPVVVTSGVHRVAQVRPSVAPVQGKGPARLAITRAPDRFNIPVVTPIFEPIWFEAAPLRAGPTA